MQKRVSYLWCNQELPRYYFSTKILSRCQSSHLPVTQHIHPGLLWQSYHVYSPGNLQNIR